MDGDGCYRQRRPENDKPSVTCQEALIELHSERHKEATRLKKRKTKGLAKRRNRL